MILNAETFYAGDPFELIRVIWSPESDLTVFELIILDVFGAYYFWPEWSEEVSGAERNVSTKNFPFLATVVRH